MVYKSCYTIYKTMRKHAINFLKYLTVGGLASILGWVVAVLFIDILDFNASIILIIMNVSIFLIKYMSYRKIKLLHKSFFRFLLISISSVVIATVSEIIMVEIFSIPALISIPIIEIILFTLRFLAFYWLKIIQN